MIERSTGAGAGIYSDHFAFYKAVGRDTTSFDGEVEAYLFVNSIVLIEKAVTS